MLGLHAIDGTPIDSDNACMDQSAVTRPKHVPKRIAQLLVSPKAYARRTTLLSGFKWLRDNNPVARIEVDGFDPFWAVTRYSDIANISSNSALFRNGDRSTTLVPQSSDQKIRLLRGGSPHILRSLIQMDAPDHGSYRAIMQGWFTPHRIQQLEPLVRAAAREAIQASCSEPHSIVDAVPMVRGYTINVLSSVLGLPQIDCARLLRITRQFFDIGEKRGTAPFRMPEDPARHADVLSLVYSEFESHLLELAKSGREGSRDTFVATLLNARINDKPIAPLEAVSYFALLATAGHDTTASALAGAIWALCENRDELKKLQANPGLIPRLVEEAVRWTTPVQHFMRTAAEDVRIGDQNIARGDWLMLCHLSGNRDERAFDSADRFRISEATRPNLAFGYGPHTCLGKYLAQTEIRVFFEELFAILEDMELAARPQHSSSIFVGGPQRVPVRFALKRPA